LGRLFWSGRGDALAAAELGDALLAAKPFQYDADLLFSREVSTRRAPNVPDRVFRRQFLRSGFLSHLKDLRREAQALKEVVADLTLENRLLKKSMIGDGGDEA
jgi:transposase